MVPTLTGSQWREWCKRIGIDPAECPFALDACYYGNHLRSRIGALFVTSDNRIVHHAYTRRETPWAIGQSPIEVCMPLDQIASMQRGRLSLWLRLLHGFPNAWFRVRMNDGSSHDLILQRSGDAFATILSECRGWLLVR